MKPYRDNLPLHINDEDAFFDAELSDSDEEEYKRLVVQASPTRKRRRCSCLGRCWAELTELVVVALVFLLLIKVTLTQHRHPEENLQPEDVTLTKELPPVEHVRDSLARCSRERHDCYMHVVSHKAGLCAQLIGLFAHKVYFAQAHNRTQFTVDQTRYHYYPTRDGQPFLAGYFTPHFPIMTDKADYKAVDPLLPADLTLRDWYKQSREERNASVSVTSAALVPADIFQYRSDIHSFYGGWSKSDALYYLLVPEMCLHLQFNDQARRDIQSIQQRHGLPYDFDAQPSVTFHVRRTDKLIKESPLYPASDYVDKLINETGMEKVRQLKYCFLATDDHNTVIPELQKALAMHGITCALHFSRPDHALQEDPGAVGVRYEADNALIFMSEMDMMIRATYFVGTFSSNVGEVVAVLRACADRSLVHEHYARSYAVDQDMWWYR